MQMAAEPGEIMSRWLGVKKSTCCEVWKSSSNSSRHQSGGAFEDLSRGKKRKALVASL